MKVDADTIRKSGITSLLESMSTIGKSVLHSIAPDNIEYYLCTLELLDFDRNQVGMITFTVMPNNISESSSPIQSQVKTNSGIITLFNESFAPINISIQGTFGRRFRIVSNILNPVENSKTYNFFNGNFAKLKMGYKSGYGMIKVLEYILKTANKLDNKGRPYILVFNNFSFNTSYVVDVVNFSFNNSIENNMLWFYDIQLKAVATAESIFTETERFTKFLVNVASNSIANSLTKFLNDIKRNDDFYLL